MSDKNQASDHDDAHTGPVKNPRQLLVTVFFSFVLPIFIIIGLVYYVASGDKPAAGAVNVEKAVTARIQKVGIVEVRDANRQLRSGDRHGPGTDGEGLASRTTHRTRRCRGGAWCHRRGHRGEVRPSARAPGTVF